MFMKACLDDEAVGGIVVGLALFFLFLSVSWNYSLNSSAIISISVGNDREDFEAVAWKECCEVDQQSK